MKKTKYRNVKNAIKPNTAFNLHNIIISTSLSIKLQKSIMFKRKSILFLTSRVD